MSEPIPISEYIEKTLTPQLRELRLKPQQVRMVVADVRKRLESIAVHWNDEAVRRTLLTIGYEEAAFYEPKDVDLDIRAMVVLAVRNSLLEDLAASRAATVGLGLSKPVLTDAGMPAFTRAAIECFKNLPVHAIKARTEHLEGAMLDREGIHIKTEGNTMRTRFIGFRDGNTCELSSRKHCAISRFAVFVDDFQEFDPKVVEGEDDVEEMKK